MQMRGNLHRYRVSSSGKRNRMLQGTFIPSYRAVLKFAAYGLLYTLTGEILKFYISRALDLNINKLMIVISLKIVIIGFLTTQ